uniref:Bridge-like lipid transfer protein family member 1 N-terminal domain-containing protein n=1 Tax=Parascaris univalens TaxID=6257 RepID=A0A915A2D4_PARUN
QDLLNEISSEAVNDIFAFVPTIWKFNIECSDFEIIFILNDKNWIDASSPGENLLASVVGSNMHTTLDITNDHFCKQRSHIWASIEAHNSLAGRFRLPDKSTMSPALQSLHKDAYFAGYAPSVDLPANTELPSGWIDFWRTESVTVTIGLMYHPFYQIQKSDLPESAIPSQFAAKPSHPFMLEEDTLDITVNFVLAQPEIFFPLLFLSFIVCSPCSLF